MIFRKTVVLCASLALMLIAVGIAGTETGVVDQAQAKNKANAKKKVKPKLTFTIAELSQRRILNRGFLNVRITSARKGKLRLRGLSATFDGREKYKPLTNVLRPNFKRAGATRVIKLKLTAAGKRAIASCEDRDLKVKVGGKLSRPQALKRLTANCAAGPVDLSRAAHCNFVAAQNTDICMSPFPDNYYTLADNRTDSGRRVNFNESAMPKNQEQIPINPDPLRASDGFSQGQTISVRVPGLDNPEALARTAPVGLSAPARYLDANAPVVVLNARTRERHPIWVEIDSTTSSASSTNLLIRPMVNFDSATRYIVVLRNLKDAAGNTLKAPAGFRYYRDFLPSTNSRINGRRSIYEDMFRRLRNSGIKRAPLYLVWDFTTASDKNNSDRALSMRDTAFGELGDSDLADRKVEGGAPLFEVTSVQSNPSSQIARRIKGTYEVPCFLEHPSSANQCASGATLKLDSAGKPQINGSYTAKFECIVPNSIANPASVDPAQLPDPELRGRAIVYGHGLMGSIAGEIHADAQRLTAARGFTICGTDEIGMATEDIVTVGAALADLSNFPKVADRLQQGLLNEMLLGRLMIHPQGLISKRAFRFDSTDPNPENVPAGEINDEVPGDSTLEPVLKTGENVRAWYRGISQGGIMGGALMALAPDFDRGALGVTGMNYSVLLTRSTAWDRYGAFFNPSYTNEIERPLALSITQMLWDRADPNGYANRMTSNPLPDTPPHQVLMDTAFGDHLVTNWQANAKARTVGAKAVAPLLDSNRWPGVDWAWGIEPIESYPYEGSAIAYWDSGPLRSGLDPSTTIGTNPPPLTNTAPSEGEDPHEHPRLTDTAIEMIDQFLRDGGKVVNPCAPGPCFADGWAGS